MQLLKNKIFYYINIMLTRKQMWRRTNIKKDNTIYVDNKNIYKKNIVNKTNFNNNIKLS